jgi:hypothetical protein
MQHSQPSTSQPKQAPYRVERAGASHGLGYGRGWIAYHRPTHLGVHKRTWVEAIAWTLSDHQWRTDRDRVRRLLESVR